MKTNYGAVVAQYQHYTSDDNTKDIELRLGRTPAHRALGDVRGKTVLDFGCGPAVNSRRLIDAGARVIGFDIDPVVIEKARQVDRESDYRVYERPLYREFGRTQVDHILMSFSFCVISDMELRLLLRHMRRLLKDGGKLVIVEPNQEKSHGIQYESLHYHKKEGVKSGDRVNVTLGSGKDAILLTDDIFRYHSDYIRLLRNAKFKVERVEEPMPDENWGTGRELLVKYPPFVLFVAT